MNLSDIKNLISEAGKAVFVENDKVVGVFLSYEEYRKINGKKEEQKSISTLPLSSSDEKDAEVIIEPLFQASVQEPEVIIEGPVAKLVSEPVKLESDLTAIKSEEELTVDDLPF